MFVTFGGEIVRFSGRVVEIFMFDVDFMKGRKLVPRTVLEPLYIHYFQRYIVYEDGTMKNDKCARIA